MGDTDSRDAVVLAVVVLAPAVGMLLAEGVAMWLR